MIIGYSRYIQGGRIFTGAACRSVVGEAGRKDVNIVGARLEIPQGKDTPAGEESFTESSTAAAPACATLRTVPEG